MSIFHHFKLLPALAAIALVATLPAAAAPTKTAVSKAMPAKAASQPAAPTVRLAADNHALMPIVVSAKASKATRATAQTLADYLGKISGATFTVQEGDGASGIVLGVAGDFDKLPVKADFPTGPFERETYRLTSTPGGIYLLGATDLAVQHAAWDLLGRFGYRQFFPVADWEVIPSMKTLSISVDTQQRPAIYSRRIWYNWGQTDYNRQTWADWNARNRMAQGFQLNSGHAYGSIISANKKEFDAHPEYYALVNGQRRVDSESKMCISNPGLRKLVVDWAVAQVKANPNIDSISMEPSDGGGWCECPECAKMGSPSNRALTLANEVADAINKLGLGDKYVGMYAYNQHCAPPTIRVHPKVIISTTTAFITGGLSLDQIIDGWKKQGATIGIYDYYTVMEWDWNLPRAAKAANPVAVADSLRTFYNKGARFYDCESGDAWGPYGLGFYVASKAMWDPTTVADQVPAIVDDFLTKAFGPAKEPMSRFYNLITVDTVRRSTGDMLARMYRDLAEARDLAKDRPDVRRRIDDLIQYTHYVELYNNYSTTSGAAQQAARDKMLTYSYRMRKTSMVHYYSLWARTVGQAAEADPKQPLKSQEPITEAEIETYLKEGIANNQPVEMGFTPVDFTTDLVPATPLNLPQVPLGSFPLEPQDHQTYYIWTPQPKSDFTMKVTVERKWALRPHQISVYSPQEATGKPVAESTGVVKPDGKTYDVTLQSPYAGLHRVEVLDGGDFTRIVWPAGMPVTLPSAIDSPAVTSHFRGPWTLYFYVPKGTKVVGGWAARIAQWAPPVSGTLKDGAGNVVLDFGKQEPGWFHVAVPAGQDGKLWKFENSQGTRQLMTVPPYLARNGQELLLPKEVVQKDSR